MRLLAFEGDSWNEKEMLRSDDLSQGIGKPEPLRYGLSGYWSRRLTQQQRLIYYFNDTFIYIVAVGGHYEDK